MIIILFFYGLAIRSMEVRVQTIEDSIVENNLWGKLDQVQDAALESLKQINRMPKAQD